MELESLHEKDWKEVIRCLNLFELASRLIECGLLTLGHPVKNTHKDRARFITTVREGGTEGFLKFSSCFVSEDDHMGHAFIACLLNGKRFADEASLQESSEYRAIISSNMQKVVRLLKLKSLIPQFLEKRLITTDEARDIRSHRESVKNVHKFFEILETKGPTSFSVFVECLSREEEHSGHKELYSLFLETKLLFSPSPKRRKPAELTTEGPLSDQEYHDRRHQFEEYYHIGQWDSVYALACDCMESSIYEIQVIGHLELALSFIFRENEDEDLHHVGIAETVCKKIENSNREFLSGRCKYLLALLYYYLDDQVKAERYVTEAKGLLFCVEIAEDRSFAMYCDAIISAKQLIDDSSQTEFAKVTWKFERALEYSLYSKDMDILVVYSFLRLGRLYLGTTATKIKVSVSNERIQQSKDCQQKLKASYYDKMDERCKGLYYLNECDLFRSFSQNGSALDSAKQAEMYAHVCGCPMDVQAVQIRLKALTSASA